MFIEPMITWVPSKFYGYIWLDTKIVLKKWKSFFIFFYYSEEHVYKGILILFLSHLHDIWNDVN